MHFYSGPLMHLLSGVDTFPRIRGGTPRDLPSSSASGSAMSCGFPGVSFNACLIERRHRIGARCVEAYHLHRPRLERIAEWKVRRRQSDTTLTLARPDDS